LKNSQTENKTNPLLLSILRWFDTEAGIIRSDEDAVKKVEWMRILPFAVLHLGCLGVFWVGWSPVAIIVALALYVIRMFAITGFYHRYFSHKAFKTNRFWQFVFAVIGNSSAQRGPLWWSAHHRHHHRYADQQKDVHSPIQHGFWWSHMGWLTSQANFATKNKYIREWLRYPELRWLNRFDNVVPLLLAAALYACGEIFNKFYPQLGTSGAQLLIWGFFISSTVLFHATVSINSLDHMFGKRRYDTPDTSRNNLTLAIITLGEGWHNNHHRYAISARQGFYWWEIDITFYMLKLLSWVGIVWDLRPVPERIRSSH
jgi:stearoyl-CoA desaturase (delta-9 desaturase)